MPHKRTQHQLELQTHQLRRVLANRQLEVRMLHSELHAQPDERRTLFDVRGTLSAGLAQVKSLTQELQRAFRSAAVRLELDENGERMQIHVAGEQPPVPLLDVLALLEEVPPLTAVLGWTTADQPVLLDFQMDEAHHVLVAGQTAAGKTTLLRSIALSLALHNRERDVQLLLINGRPNHAPAEHDGLRPFNYLPHLLTPVVEDAAEAREALLFLMEEAQYRQKQRCTTPAIVVIIDHVVSLLEQGGRDVLVPLTHLLRRGAASGIHLLLSTSRPAAPILRDLYDAYIPARLVGRVASAAEAEIAADALDSQAEQLQGAGDFLAVAGNLITHFQAAAVSDYDVHYALETLYEQRPPVVVAQRFDPRPRPRVVAEPPVQYDLPSSLAVAPPAAPVVVQSPPPVTNKVSPPVSAPVPVIQPHPAPVFTAVPEPSSPELADEDKEEAAEAEPEEKAAVVSPPAPEVSAPFAPGVWLKAPPKPAPRPVPRPAAVPMAAEADEGIPFSWESPRAQFVAEEPAPEPPSAPVPDDVAEPEVVLAATPKRHPKRPSFPQVRSLLRDVQQSLVENPPTPPQPAVEAAVDPPAAEPLPADDELALEQFDDGWQSTPWPEPPTAEPAEPADPSDAPTATTIRVTSGQSAVLRYPASLQRQRQRRYQ